MSLRIHILHIASGDFFSTYGGGQVYVRNVVDELAREGVTVSVLSFTGSSVVTERSYHEARLYEVGEMPDRQMAELIQAIRPDVIHAHSHKDKLCRIGKTLDIPVIVTAHHGGIVCPAGALMDCHDSICHTTVSHRHCLRCVLRNIRTGLWWYPMMRLLPENTYISLGLYLRKRPFIEFVTPIGQAALSVHRHESFWQTVIDDCSLMIAPSEAIGAAMLRNGLDERKLAVVPHGVPLPDAVPPLLSTAGGIRFFYVGRICYVKGIHILLAAFHQLKDTRAELHLIGGSGNKQEERYEKKLKKKYAADRRIVWHGKQQADEIQDTVGHFHVAVVPTICLEAYGLNITEALSLGKPVLATRCGGAEMQVVDGVNGWLVAANDSSAMTAAMEHIVSHPDTLPLMSSRCRATSIEEHCHRLLELYARQQECHTHDK